MQPKDLEKIPLQVEKMFLEMQDRVMEDVVRRIRKTGGITSTADYQIQKMIIFGNSTEFIESEIERLLNATAPEVWEIYDTVIEQDYTRNKSVYEQIDRHFTPYEDNKVMQSWVKAIGKQTKDELTNIAQSLGFSLLYGNKRVFTPLSEYYQKYLDRACLDVVTGAFDYNTVLRRVVKEMSVSGIRTVSYANGYSNRIEVAARRSVLTGVHQLSAKINEQVAKDLETDTYEVTAHFGARPSHQIWQGGVYTEQELESICGLGSGDGLCGWNCRHSYYAFIPGVSVRAYTDEQLEEMKRVDNEVKAWKGKEYNGYTATQKQRQLETTMRAQRASVKQLKNGKAEAEDIQIAQAKYVQTLHEYQAFSKKMGLSEQMERVYMDGLGRIAPSDKTQIAQYTTKMLKNATRDSKQYERYKSISGDSAGTLAEFRQMKYNDSEKFELLKKKVDTYSEINKKDWSAEFKQKSKDAYDRFSKENIYLSTHALSRLPRLNKSGYVSIDETDVKQLLDSSPNYKESDSKIAYFSGEKQLAIIKNVETGDVVTIVRTKKPKGDWEDV